MARSNIIEKTAEEVVAANPSKAFRPVFATTPIIPASYDGKHVCMMAVAVDDELTEGQMDALETAIGNITGVHKAFCLIGPARIPVDRIPVDYDLRIGIEAKFTIKPTPIEE